MVMAVPNTSSSVPADGSITNAKLAANSVATTNIIDANVTTAKIADGAITPPKLNGAQSGNAPIYGVRAWVNFNGTGTVAIRSSGNVSSITDNGAGNYTVNLATAMPDANYAVSLGASFDDATDNTSTTTCFTANNLGTASFRLRFAGSANNLLDATNIFAMVIR